MRPAATAGRVFAAALTVLTLGAAVRPARAAADSPGPSSPAPRLSEALGLLEAWVEAERAYLDIPGVSMAVVHDDEVIWRKGFGLAHRETGVAATPDTLYSICSISKLFTSIGVMQLRDEGRLRLDEPITTYLPWFDLAQVHPDSPPITLRGILTHSSGLPRESAQPYWEGPDFPFPTRDEVIAGLRTQETLYAADRVFQYSNLGLTLAGEVVAAVSGEPYERYVEERVLGPLGMTATTPWLPEKERGRRLATGYGRRQRQGPREALHFFQAQAIAPAAGYASSANDLAAFAAWQLRLLRDGGTDVLRASTLREMQHVHWMDPDWKNSWGLGFAVARVGETTLVGHGGSCPGYRTQVAIAPADGFGVAFLSNAIDVDAELFTRGAYELVAPALAAKKKAAGQAADAVSAPPAFDASLYAGLYQSVWREAVVAPWRGGLALLRVPSDQPMRALETFTHVGGHVFRRDRDDGEQGETLTFELAPDGTVARLRRHGNAMERER